MIRFFAKLPNNKVFALLYVTILATSSSLAQPSAYLDKLSTPDLTQTDSRGQFAENGTNYCAPVAVSNSFVWLSEHGYPKLLPNNDNSLSQKNNQIDITNKQIALAKILSSSEYMNTKADEGTYVDNVLLGIKKYILQQGYFIKQLSYQGFRSSLAEFDVGIRSPSFSFIKTRVNWQFRRLA